MKSEKNLHVLYIITKLELGGAQKICLSLMDGLQKAGHYPGLISGNQGVLVSEIKNFSSVYLIDSFKREVTLLSIFNEIKTFFLMIKYIRQFKKKYAHVIVHTHSTKAGLLGRWAAFFAGVKKRIHTIHGFGFHDYQVKPKKNLIIFLEYLTSFITSHYICVSQKDQEEGIKRFPWFEQKSSLIRAAVVWDNFFIPAQKIKSLSTNMQEIDYTVFTLGTISCFKPQKNLIDLLKAFKLVVQEIKTKAVSTRLKLQIIGDGVLRKDLEAWIIKNNMIKDIELLGWQQNSASWLHTWDLFVMSSLWEGLPCAIIEARLSKLPVVAYSVGGIAEVVFNYQNGFLIEPCNWQALAERITQLILDRTLYHSMRFFNDNLTDFNDAVMIQKHISLYQGIIETSS